MQRNELKCMECGNHFSSEELLREHFHIEHPDETFEGPERPDEPFHISFELNKHMNKSTLIGFFIGVLVTMAGVTTAVYVQDLMEKELDVKVVTCNNCSYERFKTATDRMFVTNYQEINYESERGSELVQKYDINYVPAFIYEKNIEDMENFSQVRNSLVKFEDAYVMSDKGEKIAQRFSEGYPIRNQE